MQQLSMHGVHDHHRQTAFITDHNNNNNNNNTTNTNTNTNHHELEGQLRPCCIIRTMVFDL